MHYACQVTSGKVYSVAFSMFSNLIDDSLLHRGGISKFTLCFHVFSSPYLSEEFALKVSLKLQTRKLAAIRYLEHKRLIQ